MVDGSARVEAELAYQRALTALHDVRADLADVAAAQRRLAYQRLQLSAAEAAALGEGLEARRAQLAARAAELREEAIRLREGVRRFAGDAGVEPDELPPAAPPSGFEQPPFQGEER
ncbi:MAG: hypothetical protein QM779_09985 [Propionicimonas sp.]|uniref:hypothetical protein n=1 Tax=Propionicimonas sp. TaxID=1955623 RepID=UPI003D12CEC3